MSGWRVRAGWIVTGELVDGMDMDTETQSGAWMELVMLPLGWLTRKLFSDLDGGDEARLGEREDSTSMISVALEDAEDILKGVDVGVEIPTARTLDGGGVRDSSSMTILRFLELVEGVSQKEHFQSFGWVLVLRLL